MKFLLDPNSVESYRLFIKAKGLPKFRCRGSEIEVPDEYAGFLGLAADQDQQTEYTPTRLALKQTTVRRKAGHGEEK